MKPDELFTYYNNKGIIEKYYFENGYGASVIKHCGSYGGNDGLWELAVIKKSKTNEWKLCYDTPITNDVIGHLTRREFMELLEKIKNL